MNKFNFDSMLKHGFLIIPKSLLQQTIENDHSKEDEVIALLIILMKVNYSETRYVGLHSKEYVCQRGESLRSFRDWQRLAIDKIDEYYYHQNNRKFILQASTYLANKAFLNEY